MNPQKISFKDYCEDTLGKRFSKISNAEKIALRRLYDESLARADEKKVVIYEWLTPNDVRYFLNCSSKIWLVSAAFLLVGLGSVSACFTWNGVGTIANLLAGLAAEAYTITVSEDHMLWWNYRHESVYHYAIMLYNTIIYWIVSLPLQIIRCCVWLMTKGKIKRQ